MRATLVISLTGIIILALGFIFHLQGQAIVGPESSFMYSNPEWISIGQQIAILGAVICGTGIVIKFFKKINK